MSPKSNAQPFEGLDRRQSLLRFLLFDLSFRNAASVAIVLVDTPAQARGGWSPFNVKASLHCYRWLPDGTLNNHVP